MPTDRLFRFSICGLMFLLSSAFFFYLFGIPTEEIAKEVKNGSDQLLAVIAVFISSPILGVIISTIAIGTLFLFRGYRVYYYVPSETDIIQNLLKPASDEDKMFIVNNIYRGETRRAIKKLYPFYQSVVKTCIKEEALFFLERRWSTYWTHVNNLFSIGLSLAIMIAIKASSGITACSLGVYKVTGIAILIAYIISAIANLIHSRDDAVKVEHIWLKRHFEQQAEAEKQKKDNSTIPQSTTPPLIQLIIQGLNKLL